MIAAGEMLKVRIGAQRRRKREPQAASAAGQAKPCVLPEGSPGDSRNRRISSKLSQALAR